MKTNKLYKNIKEKLANRTIEPSVSAWERLSVQLDEQPKKKKKAWFIYLGAAASILLLFSIGIQLFTNNSQDLPIIEEVVIKEIDTDLIDKNLEKLNNEIPVEKAIVKTDRVELEKKIIPLDRNKQNKRIIRKSLKKEPQILIANNEPKAIDIIKNISLTNKEITKKIDLKQNPNSVIKINAADLLYSVTHSQKEVEVYYAKNNISREEVLNTIKNELKKSNLKVNPNAILAEVERTINDNAFENNFLKKLKKRVSNIATVIASRND